MSEFVIERSALPPALVEWLEAEIGSDEPDVVMLRRENGRIVFQRANRANPKVMESVRRLAVKHAKLLERLADA